MCSVDDLNTRVLKLIVRIDTKDIDIVSYREKTKNPYYDINPYLFADLRRCYKKVFKEKLDRDRLDFKFFKMVSASDRFFDITIIPSKEYMSEWLDINREVFKRFTKEIYYIGEINLFYELVQVDSIMVEGASEEDEQDNQV